MYYKCSKVNFRKNIKYKYKLIFYKSKYILHFYIMYKYDM